VALSSQANYTDWGTATCRRNLVPTFVDRGVSRGQRGRSSTVVNLSFLDRSRCFSFKQLLSYSHKGWVDPVLDPLLLRKPGSAGNRTRDLWVSSQELWLLDHRGGHTEDNKKKKMRELVYPCLEWESNPWARQSGERRRFIHKTERPLWLSTCSHLIFYLLLSFVTKMWISLRGTVLPVFYRHNIGVYNFMVFWLTVIMSDTILHL
jgi:hypothetical protein